MGLRSVSGCTHFGIASIGVSPPDSIASGGLMKKLISCVWLAERANVETKVPGAMADSKEHAHAASSSARPPRDGLADTRRATAVPRTTLGIDRIDNRA